MDDDKKQEMPIPRTVGEMIEFLKKFPKDYALDLCYIDVGDNGSEWETSAMHMMVKSLEYSKALELTIK